MRDTFIGAIYHPPAPLYKTSDLLDHIETVVLQIQQDFPKSHIILAGDLNSLSDAEVVIRTGLIYCGNITIYGILSNCNSKQLHGDRHI